MCKRISLLLLDIVADAFVVEQDRMPLCICILMLMKLGVPAFVSFKDDGIYFLHTMCMSV